ncbi:MAG: ABC-F family ATP-binding cassette domain-containing protein [Candidatus Sericytochromatia bacterium]|nr:ABC-F family ATP-binding cassette domain-containing protein [Candidatus Sericytochromatia bacterium]
MIAFNQVAKFQSKRFLFRDASFQINPGDRVGLVGPNGAGKTTVMRLIARQESPDEGQIVIPERFRVAYYSQDMTEVRGVSVLEAALAGCSDVLALAREVERLGEALADPALDDEAMNDLLEQLGQAQETYEARGGYDLETRAKEILGGLGFRADQLDQDVAEFSGGWRMRIELAKALLQQPDALVLDEPTNHLDLESILWLEDFLQRFKGAVFLTSHDRDFMNRLVTRVVAVEHGEISTYGGDYDFYERERDIRLANLMAQAKRQEDKLAKEEEFIARFKARASHAAQVQSRIKMIEKMDRVEVPKDARTVEILWPECPRGGDVAAIVKDLDMRYGSHQVLAGVELDVRRGERVAVMGVNGAGKSTLLKILAGELTPTGGDARVGAGIKAAYFAQHQTEILSREGTVFDAVAEVVPTANRGVVQNILASLMFSGDDVEKKVSVLSGGEKTRVVLARIVANPCNLLILDEPTNHLDIRSREILLEALKRFDGTIMFVSHDRHFLRELATKVVVIDKGHTTIYSGGLGHFLEKNAGRFPGSEHTLRVG